MNIYLTSRPSLPQPLPPLPKTILPSTPKTFRNQPRCHKNYTPPRPLLSGHFIDQGDMNRARAQGSGVREAVFIIAGSGVEVVIWIGTPSSSG